MEMINMILNNCIQLIREEIIKYFDSNNIIENSRELFFSPDKKYQLVTVEYKQIKPDCNWIVTNVMIRENHSGEKLFDFFSNYGSFFHKWIFKNNVQFLICAEDIYGG